MQDIVYKLVPNLQDSKLPHKLTTAAALTQFSFLSITLHADEVPQINELGTDGNNRNIRGLCRGINEFKKGYQPRTNFVKYDKGDLFVVSHSIFNR